MGLEDDSSSDAFNPPQPHIKRRKLNQPLQQSPEQQPLPPRQRRRTNSHQDSDSSVPQKKTRKPKHRIHIPKHQPQWEAGSTLGGLLPLSRPAPAIDHGLPKRNGSLLSTRNGPVAAAGQTKGPTPKPGPELTAPESRSVDVAPPSPDDSSTDSQDDNMLPPTRDTFATVAAGKSTGNNEDAVHGNSIDMTAAQDLLHDLPSDAFSSSQFSLAKARNPEPIRISSSQPNEFALRPSNKPMAPTNGYRQTTLFDATAQGFARPTETSSRLNVSSTQRNEPPTHHVLNPEAIKTWVYPMNLGGIRDYQFNIVARGLFHNLLVALPTGLGKTFIAATIMLNWFRWTRDAQIVFVAPTKPLVSQQVEACFGIAGIPRSETTMLTGGITPALRAEEWSSKRVFFMTPQTIMNDLKTGICDPKRIVLLVVDEAHRATGAYAYNEVVKFIRRFNQSFRVLALTATPGGSVEAVQEVINGLDISRVEIRTEFSLDIRQYVYSRKTDVIPFENSMEMEMIMEQFSKAVQPVLNKLSQFNVYWSKDPMSLTPYGLTQARAKWIASDAGKRADASAKAVVFKITSVLASLAHNIELLKYHGIGPFFHGMVAFRSTVEAANAAKYEKQILESEPFQNMMRRLQTWINNPAFIGHPKLEFLQELVMNHFMDAGEGRDTSNSAGPSATRVMIFAHYRDSAEEIVRVLKRNEPMVRAHVFVGQAASKGSEGMDQKQQLEIIQKFKNATFNTLVATSIGEEGLDIGEIDLIVCYDASASPIRMLQRMGRTGRKRAGNIKMLLMKGKEEHSFTQAKDAYEKMQKVIADGRRFEFHHDRSPRIVPNDVQPLVDKRVVDIPVENSQADLPEPKRRPRAPKRPPKKFHMPDGVRTGFIKASRIQGDDENEESVEMNRRVRKQPPSRDANKEPAEIPSLCEVLLNEAEKKKLARNYQDIADNCDEDVIISKPQLSLHPGRQRCQGKTKFVRHGAGSTNFVNMVQSMHRVNATHVERWELSSLNMSINKLCDKVPALHSESDSEDPMPKPIKAVAKRTTKRGSSKRSVGKRRTAAASDAVEAPSSEPPPTSPGMQLRSQAISLGSDTSGDDEEDGEPESTLKEFVVESDQMESDPEIGLTSSLSLPVSRVKPSQASQESLAVYESDESEIELPFTVKSRLQTHIDDPEFQEDSRRDSGIGHVADGKAVAEQKRRRHVIEDSSD